MATSDPVGRDFRLGEWLVQPSRGRVRRGEESVHVTPRAMAVLVHLAEAGGAVVSRNDILDAVWKRMSVTPDALTQCITELRRVFSDDSKKPRVIETIPKVGVRLIAPTNLAEPAAVEKATDGTHAGQDTLETTVAEVPAARRALVWSTPAFGMALLVGIVLGLAIDRAPVRGRSIAVLPFAYEGAPGHAIELFASGLYEELVSQLVTISALEKVVSRQSVMRYRGTDKGIREIGRELDVATILELTLRRERESVRVVATLVDTDTEATIWRSPGYDRELTTESLFALQTEVAVEIASELEAAITGQAHAPLTQVRALREWQPVHDRTDGK